MAAAAAVVSRFFFLLLKIIIRAGVRVVDDERIIRVCVCRQRGDDVPVIFSVFFLSLQNARFKFKLKMKKKTHSMSFIHKTQRGVGEARCASKHGRGFPMVYVRARYRHTPPPCTYVRVFFTTNNYDFSLKSPSRLLCVSNGGSDHVFRFNTSVHQVAESNVVYDVPYDVLTR